MIAIGKPFTTGQLYTDRLIAMAGPQVAQPRLVRIGANTDEITAGELKSGDSRVISGSVFGGRTAGSAAFLGRYHNQISVLENSDERLFRGWANPCGSFLCASHTDFRLKQVSSIQLPLQLMVVSVQWYRLAITKSNAA